jgi:hypothetical protein
VISLKYGTAVIIIIIIIYPRNIVCLRYVILHTHIKIIADSNSNNNNNNNIILFFIFRLLGNLLNNEDMLHNLCSSFNKMPFILSGRIKINYVCYSVSKSLKFAPIFIYVFV